MKEIENTKGLDEPGSEMDLSTLSDRQLLEALLEQQSLSNIVLLRLYDIAISAYGDASPAEATKLAQLHQKGEFRSPLP